MAEQIAIFGGTFDPIHLGHLQMARYALSYADRVCFLPNGQPPHKNGAGADKWQRLEMIKLAISDHPSFFVSDYELQKTDVCYTVDTMTYFYTILGEKPLFMLGADSLRDITSWYQAERLPSLCRLLAFARVCEGTDVRTRARELVRMGFEITVSDMPQIELDSTTIRKRIADDLPTDDMIPAAVSRYIKEQKLYREL